MAKQHECYQDALQELIDNAVAANVPDEQYFESPDERVEIVLNIVRDEETVKTFIADNGPGIAKDDLREHVFRTGHKERSEGILNNVGWGLKASIAWFERTLTQHDVDPENGWFSLVTQTETGPIHRVNGPITGELPIQEVGTQDWGIGVDGANTDLASIDHGTRIHVSCSRKQFDADVWPSADALDIKVQYLRERFGVLFRRLLAAREDNHFYINYHDLSTGQRGTTEVVPLFPEYEDESEESGDYQEQSFVIEDAAGKRFRVEYEHGTLDYDAMSSAIGDEHPELLTTSGRFRFRYRPSQKHQGIDIYANGRVLMTSVFTDLFDLTRNNQYNYFGGILRIIPQDPGHEVPTDNKKTRIDTNSVLWQRIQQELSKPEFQPAGKDYQGTAIGNAKPEHRNRDREDYFAEIETDNDPVESIQEIQALDDIFGLHRADARSLQAYLQSSVDSEVLPELVDVTITSPPYFDLKDYGYDTDDQIGQQESYREYLNNLRAVFHDLYHVTDDAGSLWVVVNSFRRDRELIQLPADIARVCQNIGAVDRCPDCSTGEITVPLEPNWLTGEFACPNCEFEVGARDESWVLRDTIVWNKRRARPFTNHGQFRNVHEHILCFSKGTEFEFDLDAIRVAEPAEFEDWWVDYPERYHPRGMLPNNIWEFKSPDRGVFTDSEINHPTPLPPELIARIVRLTTDEGGVVMDPFAGSGSVLAQATAMDRRAIGFELSEKFCDTYEDVKAELHQRWENRDERKEDQQERLARIISSMRHVKHSREHLRKMAREMNVSVPADLDIHTVFHLANVADHRAVDSISHGHADVLFVADNGISTQAQARYQALLEETAEVRPCSGFGIRVSPKILTTERFLEEIVDEQHPHLNGQLYLYENGRHYAYAQEIELDDWVQYVVSQSGWREAFANHNCPPIVSNLKLDVNHPNYDLETLPRETSPDHEAALVGVDPDCEFSVEMADRR
jgi:DNA modification methylase